MLEVVPKSRGWSRVARLARAGGVAAVVTGALVGALTQYPHLARVGEVQVVGNEHASTVAIRHLADVNEGDPLLLLDLEHTLAQVDLHPWVAEARVRRVLPNTLVIEVVEHQTSLLLLHDGLYRVNGEGKVFTRARSEDLDAPILTGIDPELIESQPLVAERLVIDALEVLGAVRDSDALSADDLSEIHFDPALGFSLVLRNGSTILLGYRAPAPSLQRLDSMVASGLDLAQPLRIDLDLDGLAVATPRAS